MKVYIRTPARLHLGLIDLRGDLGRIFGGVGLAINHPNVILEAQPSESLEVVGEKTNAVKSLVKQFSETYPIKANLSINVKGTIPEHVGLGSGTQLALAVAAALAKTFHVEASIQELAITTGRGKISGVGTAVFEQGGLVVEGGVKIEKDRSRFPIPEGFPPVIFHQSFPEDWKFVVATPNVKRGLTADEEEVAFRELPPMSASDVGKICRLIMMKLLPSLIERDIKNFGDALTRIQVIVGEYFAEVQGGRYSSSEVGESIEFMRKLGVYGLGQSSWGPTFYGLVQGGREAKKIKSEVQAFLNKRAGGQVFIAKADNKGAYIKIVKDGV